MALRVFQPQNKTSSELKLLNVGCGRHYDQRWTNLDLQSNDPKVHIHDVTKGVPFTNEHFDAVYHSHILEHLKPNLGQELINECFRVLKPGGVLRIVVPDLERIAKLYLETHERAWENETGAQTDFDWMKLELLDQLVREHSGGRMGPYMANQEIKNSEFVQWRVGNEFEFCRGLDKACPEVKKRKPVLVRVMSATKQAREKLARTCVRLLMGHEGESALDEGLFRSRGEIHRWMYDRYSLKRLCTEHGFVDFHVCEAHESEIENFAEYHLDTLGELIRKPDSLFVECRKPAAACAFKNSNNAAA